MTVTVSHRIGEKIMEFILLPKPIQPHPFQTYWQDVRNNWCK